MAERIIHWHASIDSTMYEAARLAHKGAPHGTVVGADEQTAGHGRLGRAWHSPPGAGLYVSLILRLGGPAEELPIVTLALGLAAAEAITQATGLAPDLRWPNDVLLAGRKCCGILTQLHGAAVVAGIGINVNHESFPAELRAIATSLRLQAGRTVDRDGLLRHLLAAVDDHLDILRQQGRAAILRLFTQHSSYVFGRRVLVDERDAGTTDGLNEAGFLMLRRDDGGRVPILAGGVRPLDGPGSE
jgi:BirA family biotin operon repressor/biotin-[acetyl-CoA-carboxylase] ligase